VVFFSAAHNGPPFLRVARLFGEDSSLAAENSCHGRDRCARQMIQMTRAQVLAQDLFVAKLPRGAMARD